MVFFIKIKNLIDMSFYVSVNLFAPFYKKFIKKSSPLSPPSYTRGAFVTSFAFAEKKNRKKKYLDPTFSKMAHNSV
jgi:hypothetical protein